MSHLEELGDAPTISIKPFWITEDDEERVGFDVGVSSMSITDRPPRPALRPEHHSPEA